MISRIDRLSRLLKHRYSTERAYARKRERVDNRCNRSLHTSFRTSGTLANCASKAIFMIFNISRFNLGTKLIYLLAISFGAALSPDVFVL
ncbi:hypothetical protein BDZ45DRAFT_402048 [Acephala macrosclerotiorum]|nr:hypothetical protein BDZ45DRAFT_402048 [Acephala macrosclerotiorum]